MMHRSQRRRQTVASILDALPRNSNATARTISATKMISSGR